LTEGAFREIFEPIVKVRENIRLLPVGTFWEVLFVEPLHPIEYDFGSINAGASTGDTEITDLYMREGELAQYRVILLDDITITVKQPKAKTRYATEEKVTEISPFSHQIFKTMHPNEIFIFEDEKCYFVAKNPTRYNRDVNRVRFIGWKFVLKSIAQPEKWTDIPIEGYESPRGE